MFRLSIDGNDLGHAEEYDGSDTYRVTLEDEATANGYGPFCAHCSEPIEETNRGWVHTDDDAAEYDENDDHTAAPEPLSWCNSAAITLAPTRTR